jgi:hypothetical protein
MISGNISCVKNIPDKNIIGKLNSCVMEPALSVEVEIAEIIYPMDIKVRFPAITAANKRKILSGVGSPNIVIPVAKNSIVCIIPSVSRHNVKPNISSQDDKGVAPILNKTLFSLFCAIGIAVANSPNHKTDNAKKFGR